MATLINKSQLLSRSVRRRNTRGGKVRKVNLQTLPKEGSGFQRFLKKVQGFIGGAWEIIKKNAPSIGTWIERIFNDGVRFLLSYDWNQTDAQIKEQIKQDNLQAIGAVGGAIGFAIGSFGVLGVTYLIPKIGPIIAQGAFDEVSEQVTEEIFDALRNILDTQKRNMVRTMYMSSRAFLKNNDLMRGIVQAVGGDSASTLFQQWGDGKKPWIIEGEIRERIENIPNPAARIFFEEGFEKLLDGYFGTVTIIANEVDSYIRLSEQQKSTANPKRVVEVKIDPESDSPPLRFEGRQRQILPAIQNAVASGQLLYGKEIRSPEYAIQWPRSRSAEGRERYLALEFRNFEKPDFNRPGKQTYSWSAKIPNPKVGVSFAEVKAACSSPRGYYIFGSWRAIANLPSGKIICYADTQEAVEDRMERLLRLSQDGDQFKTFSSAKVVHRKKDGTIYKPESHGQKIYPYVAVLRIRRFLDGDSGHLDLNTGTRYRDEFERMEIWREQPRYGGVSVFS